MLADDSHLYKNIHIVLHKWNKDWQVSFNPSECEVISVTRKRNPIKAKYTIHGHDLSIAKSGKYTVVLQYRKT